MSNIAIIFAGGSGQRLINSENKLPKQFLEIYGKPIIVYTLELFQYHNLIDKIYISTNPNYCEYTRNLVEKYHLSKVCGIAKGGKTGQDSIYNALKLANKENSDDSIVLIHDGVRPNVASEVITKNIKNTIKNGSAITCIPCSETILINEKENNPIIPQRKNSYIAQAPQSFHLKDIFEAHEYTRKINPNYTNIVDSCTLFRSLGKEVSIVLGNRGNIKITTIEDLYLIRSLIRYREDIKIFGLKLEK
ncbi:IspD/TarI family cytidylyltransferase [Campylobacter sp. 46490-21]|uniref:IspD/TarI family cytidylyltransferase n=1 Tax=Campylobacter magnus TaxID=3026462 RepID=UPI0023609318|nr:IspD/TarI family cytidylyltransferase [Campylobacter magnus]MDD0847617.1 IspD/TarI family cytidylyltransferase [Campylobacter magnus]